MKAKSILFLLTINYLLLTINCISQPTQEWVRRFSYADYASGRSVKLDSAENVYVLLAGYTDSTLGDCGVVKYNSAGEFQWNTFYTPGNVRPWAFAVTGSGVTYIAGTMYDPIEHCITVKFNAAGVLQWAREYYSGGTGDGLEDIKIDKEGNIIVVGGSAIANNSGRALTIKYNNNGDSLWVRRFSQLSNYSVNTAVAIDDSNNIYTCGYYADTIVRVASYLTLKYSSNGNQIWYAIYDNQQSSDDIADKIALDINRNVYVLGSNAIPWSGFNNTLVKYNSNGVMRWGRTFTGIVSGQGRCYIPAGVAVNANDSTIYYTTPCVNGNGGGGYDIVTLKYNSNGDSVWVRRYSGTVNSEASVPAAIKFDKYGDIYVCGYANYQITGRDYVTIKYSSSGIRRWAATYNSPLTNSDDGAGDLVIDSNLNVYVTGTSSRQNVYPMLWDAATIKYNQPIGINSYNNELPKEYKLFQNYPNPFNSSTKFKVQIAKLSETMVVIYDVLGKEVTTTVNQKLKPGIYEIEWDASDYPSGVYFYRLIVSDFIDTKKMILIR